MSEQRYYLCGDLDAYVYHPEKDCGEPFGICYGRRILNPLDLREILIGYHQGNFFHNCFLSIQKKESGKWVEIQKEEMVLPRYAVILDSSEDTLVSIYEYGVELESKNFATKSYFDPLVLNKIGQFGAVCTVRDEQKIKEYLLEWGIEYRFYNLKQSPKH